MLTYAAGAAAAVSLHAAGWESVSSAQQVPPPSLLYWYKSTNTDAYSLRQHYEPFDYATQGVGCVEVEVSCE
jgi:hypothetical protein